MVYSKSLFHAVVPPSTEYRGRIGSRRVTINIHMTFIIHSSMLRTSLYTSRIERLRLDLAQTERISGDPDNPLRLDACGVVEVRWPSVALPFNRHRRAILSRGLRTPVGLNSSFSGFWRKDVEFGFGLLSILLGAVFCASEIAVVLSRYVLPGLHAVRARREREWERIQKRTVRAVDDHMVQGSEDDEDDGENAHDLPRRRKKEQCSKANLLNIEAYEDVLDCLGEEQPTGVP